MKFLDKPLIDQAGPHIENWKRPGQVCECEESEERFAFASPTWSLLLPVKKNVGRYQK